MSVPAAACEADIEANTLAKAPDSLARQSANLRCSALLISATNLVRVACSARGTRVVRRTREGSTLTRAARNSSA